MSKPWLETWHKTVRVGDSVSIRNNGGTERARAACRTPSSPWADLVSAAPEMCRALLAVEWFEHDEGGIYCSYCHNGHDQKHPHSIAGEFKGPCIVDVALTKAGLPDQASRDAARKEMGI